LPLQPASQSDCGDLIQEAEEAYSQAQIDDLMNELRESGLVKFMHKYIGELAVPPRKLLMAFGVLVDPDYTNEKELYRILKMSINRVLRRRAKLPNYNTVSDAVQLIENARKIMVLSGAGVSTSCGIPGQLSFVTCDQPNVTSRLPQRERHLRQPEANTARADGPPRDVRHSRLQGGPVSILLVRQGAIPQ
jgi:hypothetical protein